MFPKASKRGVGEEPARRSDSVPPFSDFPALPSRLSNEELWNLAFTGSPVTAALALTVLDERLGGKVSELAKKIRG